ncbi:MAG: PrsW family glutamic-type intramembrane protease [Methanomassiliicoccales archaeon]
MSDADFLILAILVLAAVLPSVIFLSWFRSTGYGKKESWMHLIVLFIYGAIIAIIVAIIIEVVAISLLLNPISREYEIFTKYPSLPSLILVVLIAPISEEFAKMLGIMRFSKKIERMRSGLVFGSAVGLGFAATENLLYESIALFEGGIVTFLIVALMRSYSSALLHACASSIAGYGIARRSFNKSSVMPFYLLAVSAHGSFNLFSSLGGLFEDKNSSILANVLGLIFCFILVIIMTKVIRSRIRS